MPIDNFNNNFRVYNSSDNLVNFIDTSLRTLFGSYKTTDRPYPPKRLNNVVHLNDLTKEEQQKSAGLMRVNHCGEVCAQALYQGQALTARDPKIKNKFKQAAIEENDHLNWCKIRLSELNSHTSYLNPLWYLGSLSLGVVAGIAGDKWNLGFLAETENQVTEHLAKHLIELPLNDYKSRAIVTQMKVDEQSHAITAIEAGAHKLPAIVQYTMQLSAKLMTRTAYYL